MKTINYITLTLGLFLGVFIACTDVVNIDLLQPPAPNLVVDGLITNYPGTQTITLSLSQSYMENALPNYAHGARVSLEEAGGGNRVSFSEVETTGNYIVSSYTPTVGREYVLKIAYAGENYISTVTMRKPLVVESIAYNYSTSGGRPGGGNSKGRYAFTVTVNEPVGEGDNYRILYYSNDTLQTSQESIQIRNDAKNNRETIPDGKSYSFTLNGSGGLTDGNVKSPTVRFDFLSIDDVCYTFLELLRNQSRNGLFSPPDANLISNIKNVKGASGPKPLGLFIVSPIVIYRVSLEKKINGVVQQIFPNFQ